jgi:hypothetical protein
LKSSQQLKLTDHEFDQVAPSSHCHTTKRLFPPET